MGYSDDIKFFRDLYKNPELEPESSRAEIEAEKIKDNREGRDKRPENFTNEMVKKYQETINLINTFSLKEKFKGDPEETVVENRKETTLKLLRKILDDIEKYVSQIDSAKHHRHIQEFDDIESYQDHVGPADFSRRSSHRQLVNDIKLTMRLINVSFNKDFPDDKRVLEEKNYADRRGLSESQIKADLAKRDFVQFPHGTGVFIDWKNCPKDEGGEREFTMNWAIAFYDDLSRLKEGLDQEFKETPR